MAPRSLAIEEIEETLRVLEDTGGNVSEAARRLGITRASVDNRLRRAEQVGARPTPKPFESTPLPDELPSADELLARRRREWERRDASEKARRLVDVKVKINGPIGVVHFGDPHVDDPGTDILTLEKHVAIVNATEGLFGANVGDLQNNWVGRLARLHAEQSTSAAEAWVLTEWLVQSVHWLYLIGGNHDLWSGAGDPIRWMEKQVAVHDAWGARLALRFPNGKEVRINARHDFAGHSMWNTAHGPAKAVQMGWRDHILTCGHKHTSGYQLLKDPATGLISHALRVAGYKIHDRYGKELGLPNQNISPASVTIIDPQYADDDARLVTVIHDVEEAAEFLLWKRKRGK